MRKKKIAIYPGTFDPVTYGHLDILTRATALFDEVIIAVSEDSSKKTLFRLPERIELLHHVIAAEKRADRFHCPVRVESFRGLAVHFARKSEAGALVRGLRAVSDFEYEFQMALMNRHQFSRIETIFLMPDEKYVYLSSSIVKEIARLKGDLRGFLPPPVIRALNDKFFSHP